MAPDLGRSKVMLEVSTSKENGNSQIKYLTNYEDSTLKQDRSSLDSPVACRSSDMDINVTSETTNFRGDGVGKAEGEEATESSSSFGDSDSGVENPMSDTEVGSHFNGDSTSDLGKNEFGDLLRMRRKKLTSQWRTFVQPLMWRCKWLELQIKKCNSQALKYDKDLAAYKSRKHFQLENTDEGVCMKSLQFPNFLPRDKVMRRKRRKKVEDTSDIVSYLSNHNLFSYEGKDNRAANGARMDDNLGTQEKINGNQEPEADDRLWLQSGEGNNLLEGMLRKMDFLQLKINNLKSRMNKVTSENAEKLRLADNLGLLVNCNGDSSPTGSLSSPPTSGGRIPVQSPNIASELHSQNNMVSVGISESTVSSIADGSYHPGIVGRADRPNLQGKCMKVEDKVLKNDDGLKEEINNEVFTQPIKKPEMGNGSNQGTSPTLLIEPDLPTDDQPAPKIRSIAKLIAPKGTKKRGKRRASSSRWKRRPSG